MYTSMNKMVSDKKQYQHYTFHHCIETREGPMSSAYTQIYSWGNLINRGPTSPPKASRLWWGWSSHRPSAPTTQPEGVGLACSGMLIFSPPVSLKRVLPAASLFPDWPIHPLSEQTQIWSRAAVPPTTKGWRTSRQGISHWLHGAISQEQRNISKVCPSQIISFFPSPRLSPQGHGLFIYS